MMAVPIAVGFERRSLFVFDFDHSLIDDNTDTWIMDIRPELHLRERMRNLRRQFECWTDFMDHIFMIIHGSDCGKEEIMAHMGKLELYEQSIKAVRSALECKKSDSIIISDSNSVFIDCILCKAGLKDSFSPDHVLTNPAHFDASGRLHVQRFHNHNCQRCVSTLNMCKWTILSEFMQRNGGYNRVVYVGDGRGDYCPCVGLGEEDVVICRKGYSLSQQLTSQKGLEEVKATVHVVDFVKSLGDCIARLCSA